MHRLARLLLLLSLATAGLCLVCPTCKEKGLKSRVYSGGCTSTMAACVSYYDENGDIVTHKCNTCDCGYSCSNGHQWSTSERC